MKDAPFRPSQNLLINFPVESPASLETRVETASRLFKFTRVFGEWPRGESDEASPALFSKVTRATSMADQHDASHANRLMDMAFEDGEVRGPLAGFFPATLRVPTLEQALAPLAADYPHLHAVTGRSVKLARKKAKKAQLKYPSLTMDECIAVVLYTSEEQPRETSLYYLMNDALRSKDRKKVWPWRDFIWLLLHALRKLPVPVLPFVFRGCTKAPSELGLELEAGFEVRWRASSLPLCASRRWSKLLHRWLQTTLIFMQTLVGRSSLRARRRRKQKSSTRA